MFARGYAWWPMSFEDYDSQNPRNPEHPQITHAKAALLLVSSREANAAATGCRSSNWARSQSVSNTLSSFSLFGVGVMGGPGGSRVNPKLGGFGVMGSHKVFVPRGPRRHVWPRHGGSCLCTRPSQMPTGVSSAGHLRSRFRVTLNPKSQTLNPKPQGAECPRGQLSGWQKKTLGRQQRPSKLGKSGIARVLSCALKTRSLLSQGGMLTEA